MLYKQYQEQTDRKQREKAEKHKGWQIFDNDNSINQQKSKSIKALDQEIKPYDQLNENYKINENRNQKVKDSIMTQVQSTQETDYGSIENLYRNDQVKSPQNLNSYSLKSFRTLDPMKTKFEWQIEQRKKLKQNQELQKKYLDMQLQQMTNQKKSQLYSEGILSLTERELNSDYLKKYGFYEPKKDL